SLGALFGARDSEGIAWRDEQPQAFEGGVAQLQHHDGKEQHHPNMEPDDHGRGVPGTEKLREELRHEYVNKRSVSWEKVGDFRRWSRTPSKSHKISDSMNELLATDYTDWYG